MNTDEARQTVLDWDMVQLAQLASEVAPQSEDRIIVELTRQQAAVAAVGLAGSAAHAGQAGLNELLHHFLLTAIKFERAAVAPEPVV